MATEGVSTAAPCERTAPAGAVVSRSSAMVPLPKVIVELMPVVLLVTTNWLVTELQLTAKLGSVKAAWITVAIALWLTTPVKLIYADVIAVPFTVSVSTPEIACISARL